MAPSHLRVAAAGVYASIESSSAHVEHQQTRAGGNTEISRNSSFLKEFLLAKNSPRLAEWGGFERSFFLGCSAVTVADPNYWMWIHGEIPAIPTGS